MLIWAWIINNIIKSGKVGVYAPTFFITCKIEDDKLVFQIKYARLKKCIARKWKLYYYLIIKKIRELLD